LTRSIWAHFTLFRNYGAAPFFVFLGLLYPFLCFGDFCTLFRQRRCCTLFRQRRCGTLFRTTVRTLFRVFGTFFFFLFSRATILYSLSPLSPPLWSCPSCGKYRPYFFRDSGRAAGQGCQGCRRRRGGSSSSSSSSVQGWENTANINIGGGGDGGGEWEPSVLVLGIFLRKSLGTDPGRHRRASGGHRRSKAQEQIHVLSHALADD